MNVSEAPGATEVGMSGSPYGNLGPVSGLGQKLGGGSPLFGLE